MKCYKRVKRLYKSDTEDCETNLTWEFAQLHYFIDDKHHLSHVMYYVMTNDKNWVQTIWNWDHMHVLQLERPMTVKDQRGWFYKQPPYKHL